MSGFGAITLWIFNGESKNAVLSGYVEYVGTVFMPGFDHFSIITDFLHQNMSVNLVCKVIFRGVIILYATYCICEITN